MIDLTLTSLCNIVSRILIYSHLIIAKNVKLLKHQGRPKVKELFTIANADHEALLETLKQREDPIGILD